MEKGEGARLNDDCLLLCPPASSWLDTRLQLEGLAVPARLPEDYVRKVLAEERSTEGRKARLEKGMFLLAEVNAWWLILLREAWAGLGDGGGGAKLRQRVGDMLGRAERAYKRTFHRPEEGTIAHTVCGSGERCEASAVGLESAALLPALFTDAEVKKMLDVARKRLLVRRRGKAFGLLLRDLPERVFYDDRQYHGATVWPRETPYFISLLERAGEHKAVEELLLSNLEHQQEECCVFYCSELFSPEGDLPVPVKNPAQLWSSWVQPYLRALS